MLTRKKQRELEKDLDFFFEFLKIKKHFFKDFNDKLKEVKDPRHQSYILYDSDLILFMVILKNICGLESMRGMTRQFNKEECIDNLKQLLHLDVLEELPHYDTINDFLSELEAEELEKIRTYMIKELLKKRCFEAYRI